MVQVKLKIRRSRLLKRWAVFMSESVEEEEEE